MIPANHIPVATLIAGMEIHPDPTSRPRTSEEQPGRNLPPALLDSALLVAIVFGSELSVMAVLSTIPTLAWWTEALLDSALLVVFVVPAVYAFVLLPMARHARAREEASSALEASKAELEQRVVERTAAYEQAGREMARSLRELEQTHRENVLLAEMIEMIQICRSTAEAEVALSTFAQKLFPGVPGAVYVFRASRNLLELAVRWGRDSHACTIFAPEDCWALRMGRQHLADVEDRALHCRHGEGIAAGRTLCVPMMAQGDAIGVLVLHDSAVSAHEGFGAIAPLARRAAEQLALAIANVQLRDKLRDQAIRDPLTGLFNRRYFEEISDRELRRATREGKSVGLVAVDIDHFKRFNDTCGHEAGDAVLRAVGHVLRSSCRGEDVPCRLGGEEFVLVLPGADSETAVQCAQRLREAVEAVDVRYRGDTLPGITVSCGVSVFPACAPTLSELTLAADRALYRAKQKGRNRVESCSLLHQGS